MNIQEQLNSLIRGNPLSVDTYLREVCKNEHISDTKASMHIYMLKLDGNNRPRTCDFCDYLINRIVDYCIPPSEIRKAKEKDAEYNTTQYTATLFRKAERLFTDLGNTGEVGELALSVLTQSFLHIISMGESRIHTCQNYMERVYARRLTRRLKVHYRM